MIGEERGKILYISILQHIVFLNCPDSAGKFKVGLLLDKYIITIF
jgi:hypothetical protein